MKNLTYCPECGKKTLSYLVTTHNKWVCSTCGFTLYNNNAAAVGLIITFTKEHKEQVLLVKRGREPRKGFLAVPGGFIDPGESAEQAAYRECKEETGLEAHNIEYITSAPNVYAFKGIDYTTCDLFFHATVTNDLQSLQTLLHPTEADEITGYDLYPIETEEDINTIPLAFTSAKIALMAYKKMQK